MGESLIYTVMTCPDCNGSGSKWDSEIEMAIMCGSCDGDGFVWYREVDDE